tara:strand:- start:189 stop:851 length:663 start_codon:yes stop_codon:yes gene_type:complete
MFKILDLFCGGGGASMGYYLGAVEAGLNPMIIGVDITYKKDYPFAFLQKDVLDLIRDMPPKWWKQFDLIVASPPCQGYSRTQHLARAQGNSVSEVLLIDEIRKLLHKIKVPYVIENVEGAGLVGVTLCGSSFGLKVRRHRVFEASWEIEQPVCNHKKQGRPIGVYGSLNDDIPQGGKTARTIAEAQEAMGIDWLGWSNLKESIPPAYTHYIMLDFVKNHL